MAITARDIRSIARTHTNLAISTLVGVMVSPKAMSSAKVAAAREMLNRGWGAPHDPEDANKANLVINILRLAMANQQPETIDATPVVVQRLSDA